MAQKGFSIVEVIIANTLVATVLVSLSFLLSNTIKSSSVSNNVLIASMLAQEGIELVTNIRDTNWTTGAGWNQGISGGGGFQNKNGAIDYDDTGVTYANNFSNPKPNNDAELFCHDQVKLYLDSINNFYTHTATTTSTVFKRAVTIDSVNDSNGNPRLKVTSRVRWGDCGDDKKQVELTNYLYNWMPGA